MAPASAACLATPRSSGSGTTAWCVLASALLLSLGLGAAPLSPWRLAPAAHPAPRQPTRVAETASILAMALEGDRVEVKVCLASMTV